MVISEDAGEVSIRLNPARPIFRRTRARLILLRRQSRIGPWRRWRHFAQIIKNLAAIAERIERGDDSLAISSFPNSNVEGNANRRLLRRIWPADMRRGLPR